MSQLFNFLLMPDFSMMDFMSATEPLRSANRLGGDLYRWRSLSQDGQPVPSCNGMSIAVDGPLIDLDSGDTLFVLAAFEPLASVKVELLHWLKRQDRVGIMLGAINAGPFVLAEAGLLRGYRITLHWEAIDSFVESYPGVDVSHELFEIDRRRITSAGGTSSMDLMLELIAQTHGHDLAVRVSEQFVHGTIRPQKHLQRMTVSQRYALTNRKLQAVVERIEQNIENSPDIDALACGVNITRRQLERLFQTHLQVSPAAFCQRLRLEKARQLLQQSDLSILQISIACGFDSPSYFSRRYKEQFKCSPRQDRSVLTGKKVHSCLGVSAV